MSMTGKCLCGAVRYTIASDKTEAGACHCEMCRAWTGGVFLSVTVAKEELTLVGGEHLTVYKSSDWAERGFCSRCGSSLFYRITAPGPMEGEFHLCAGTLEDWGGATLKTEIYIDRKPAGYAFAGETRKMTKAEIEAMFAPPPDGGKA